MHSRCHFFKFERAREWSFREGAAKLSMDKLTIDQVTSLLRERGLHEVLLDTLSGKFSTWMHANSVLMIPLTSKVFILFCIV